MAGSGASSGGGMLLVLLHALGMSARSWDPVIQGLDGRFDVLALDLPGFGDNAATGARTVEESVDWTADAIRARAPSSWLAVGHSMGAKIATLLASRAEAGEAGLTGLAGLVLLAGSPPSPEPMDEARRQEMIGWWAQGTIAERDAVAFVEANVASPLPAPLMAQTVADVRRTSRHAWLAWFERGSREDWSEAVGRLATPALIVAGGQDGDLGEASQRRVMAPHFSQARVTVIADAAHLLPLEAPDAVAHLIAEEAGRLAPARVPESFMRLVASDRVSARTRAALNARLRHPDGPPALLSADQLATLDAMIGRIVPGADPRLALGLRIDAALAEGGGDGWRFADLPPDAEAWRRGLDALDALAGGFATLPAAEQDAWLVRLADGTASSGDLAGASMARWFEDVRAEAVRTWLAHPATMARIGYDGIATGGDGRRLQGFARLGASDPEPWQPHPVRAGAAA